MTTRAVLMTLLVALGCGQQPEATTISIKVFPAVPAGGPQSEPPPGWTRLEYTGGPHGRVGVYHVAPEPLISDWNILTFRDAAQPDGSMAIVARLNAYGQGKMTTFSSAAANLKRPLVVQVDGRTADIFTLLTLTTDRVTLYGFTVAETERLKKYFTTR